MFFVWKMLGAQTPGYSCKQHSRACFSGGATKLVGRGGRGAKTEGKVKKVWTKVGVRTWGVKVQNVERGRDKREMV